MPLLRIVTALLVLVVAASLLLLAAPSWLEGGTPAGGGYELRCILVPYVLEEGLYRVSVTMLEGVPLSVAASGYGEVNVSAHVSYEGLGVGRFVLGPGSLRCESSAGTQLVVEVVRGWEGEMPTRALTVASVTIGFWSRGGPVIVEYAGVDGWVRVEERGSTIISDVLVFTVKPGRG